MEEKKCKNCMFYKKTIYSKGECFRYPPQLVLDPETGSANPARPMMEEDDFCGEFKSEKLIQEIGDLIMKAFSGDIGGEDGRSV